MSTSTSLAGQIQAAADEYGTTLTKPIIALQTLRASLTSRTTAVNSIKTKMSALSLSTNAMALSSGSAKFSVYSASSTLSDVASATVSSGDSVGTHTLLVTQLAKNDTVMSARVTNTNTDAGTSLASKIGTDKKSFTIDVNGTSTQIDVTLDGSETDKDVLTKIAAAVNKELSTSLISASVVGDTSTTSKLVFTSRTTGTANAIGLADVDGGNVLDSIGLTSTVLAGADGNRTAATSTTAGYSYADSSKLDSNFTLDGISMSRSSNTVSDALSGVTLSLKSTQLSTAVPSTVTIGLDTTTIKANVQDFLTKYNSLLSTVRSQTAIDTTLKIKQVLSDDWTYVQLRSGLRSIVGSSVSSVTTGNPSTLSEVGITADSEGQLSISDTTKFNSFLTGSSSSAIADLFSSSNGVAAQMKKKMDTFLSANGILSSNDVGTTSRISAIDKKIAAYTVRNTAKMNAYKLSLANAQTVLSQLSTQSSLASSYLAKVQAGTI